MNCLRLVTPARIRPCQVPHILLRLMYGCRHAANKAGWRRSVTCCLLIWGSVDSDSDGDFGICCPSYIPDDVTTPVLQKDDAAT